MSRGGCMQVLTLLYTIISQNITRIDCVCRANK
uniref:Uncharacterized protein n=1 Tax=Rhizophora mucronata TaxID=61149 RepID=A0A2P2N8U7_RHIMU